MIKKNKIALSAAATALLAVTGLALAPQASADEMADLKARMARIEQQEADKSTRSNGNMVFFRGGYARNNVDRNDQILPSGNTVLGTNNGKDGWYVGAGLDLNLSDNMFGLNDNIQLVGEIMFEYKNFSSLDTNATGNALGNPLNALVSTNPTLSGAGAGTNHKSVTVSQFTLTASPKIKFMKNTWFNPWIIPVGLAIHVISPPSDGVTVLLPGMHFGAGADFKVWKNVYVGIDARYNLTFQTVDGVDINGMTTGAYAGFGF